MHQYPSQHSLTFGKIIISLMQCCSHDFVNIIFCCLKHNNSYFSIKFTIKQNNANIQVNFATCNILKCRWTLFYAELILFWNRTRIGNSRTVIISDYQTAKDAYGSLDFVNRPSFFQLFNINSNEQGGKPKENIYALNNLSYLVPKMHDACAVKHKT